MIHRILFSLLIAVFMFAVGPIPAPAYANATAGKTHTLSSSTNAFEGLLVVKEADGGFLIRSEKGKKKRFTVNPNTTITRNGKPASYHDLRSRDRIRVQYNANFVVTEIEATGS